METLHLRAEPKTIEVLMGIINKISQNGKEIEILDSTVIEQEQKQIIQALLEEQNSQTYDHHEVWEEILQ